MAVSVEFMLQERKGERTKKWELESEWVSEWVSERMNEWIIERASWLFIVIIFPLVSGKMHHTWWTTGRHKNHNCWQQLQFSGLLCV